MSDEKSINIDTKFDFEIAKMLIENGRCNNFPIKFLILKTFNEKKNKISITNDILIMEKIEKLNLVIINLMFIIKKININQIKKIINKFY